MATAVGAAAALVGAALVAPPAWAKEPRLPGAALAPQERSDVQANLWEWSWPSVGRECTTLLGPAGYGGVQVAPPASSLSRLAPDEETGGPGGVRHPWWEVYQPATYELDSRMGTEEEFQAMVDTCRGAGVKVSVDAVVNHMTGQGETSYSGADHDDYSYRTGAGAEPGSLYTREDFHEKGTGVDRCPTGSGDIEDFNDERQVVRCELLSLEDLRTDVPETRAKVVAHLNDLIARGVSGFRVDAAEHVGNEDLTAMLAELADTVDGERPQWALEVFRGHRTGSQREVPGVRPEPRHRAGRRDPVLRGRRHQPHREPADARPPLRHAAGLLRLHRRGGLRLTAGGRGRRHHRHRLRLRAAGVRGQGPADHRDGGLPHRRR